MMLCNTSKHFHFFIIEILLSIFFGLSCLTQAALLKVTLRNGSNEQRNQVQLFELRGCVGDSSILSLMSGHFAALRPFSTH